MTKLFTQLRQYIRSFNKGFTLIELLVALIVAAIVLSLALRLIVDLRQLFVQDQARTQINQNLRASIDIVGTDIKQAGERLVGNTQFPVVRIINGASGEGDTLLLQRNLVDQALPVCQSISPGSIPPNTSTIDVSVNTGTSSPPIDSCPFSNGNAAAPTSDPWPDNLEQWRNTRCSKDGVIGCNRNTDISSDNCIEQGGTDRECLWVYIYNPANNQSGFFLYTFEDSYVSGTQTRYRIYRGLSTAVPSQNTWANTYTYVSTQAPYTNNPAIYVIETRVYKLVNNTSPSAPPGDKVLQLTINGQDAAPIRIVNQLTDFQVKPLMVPTAPPLLEPDNFNKPPIYTEDWKLIKSIKVELTAKKQEPFYTPKNPDYLKLSSEFFMRNAASK